MADNKPDAVFISGIAKDAGFGEFYSFDSFNLDWIKDKLGSNVVQFAVFRRKEAKDNATHYLKVTASEEKFLKRNYKEEFSQSGGVQPENSDTVV